MRGENELHFECTGSLWEIQTEVTGRVLNTAEAFQAGDRVRRPGKESWDEITQEECQMRGTRAKD